MLTLALAACGSGPTPIPATLPPTLTPTPRSTALPTVATQLPLGSAERPFQIVLVPPEGSAATGTSLATFLNDRTGLAFKVEIASSSADVLNALCGATPTFGWVDGLTLLAAQAQGCSVPVLRIRLNGDSGAGATSGVRAELVTRTASRITAISGIRDKEFCRLGSQDLISWVIPVLMMRSAGFNPLTNLRAVREYPDTASMMQALVDGTCVAAAIPAGTLGQYTVTEKATPTDVSKAINSLGTSPEMPYGGLMVSSTVPKNVVDTVVRLFTEHPEELRDLVQADDLVKASTADFAEVMKLVQAAGLNLKSAIR